MDTETTPSPTHYASQWTLGARRALALALIQKLPESDNLRDILSDAEIEWAHEQGFSDPDDAYEEDSMPRVLLWDTEGNRDANAVLAEVQDIPELGAMLNELLKLATFDAIATRQTGEPVESAETINLLMAFARLLPKVDIAGWVTDIAHDRVIEIEAGFRSH